ncbi:MAG TPA: hypothetical protein VGD61_13435 [Pyrinomonadaceae bacterium]
MKKCLLLITIVVLASVVPARSRVDASAEEYAVYSAVIAEMFAGDRVTFDTQAKIKLLVIKDLTDTDVLTDYREQNEVYFGRMFPTLAAGVVKDYKARNKQPVRLKDSFDLNIKHLVVKKEKIEKIFAGRGWWQEFYKIYPDSGGLIVLSRVGFSRAMNQALVYIQHGCGGLCGTGHYVLLEKSGDRWQVVKRNMVWIS